MSDSFFAPTDVRDRHLDDQLLELFWHRRTSFARDFHRQNRRNPFRCHRTSVSGFTTMRTFFQSNSRASATIVNLVALSVRRGVCSRSTKNMSCFRRKRFSAARAPCERTRFRANAMASRRTGTIFESSRKNEPFHVQNDDRHPVGPVGAKRPILAGLNRGINAGSSFCGAQARSVLLAAQKNSKSDPLFTWALQVQKRTGHNKAAIATANKLARIVFAVLKRGTLYEPNLAR